MSPSSLSAFYFKTFENAVFSALTNLPINNLKFECAYFRPCGVV